MEVNEDILKDVAKVARLKLTDEEVQKFLPEMQEILKAFSKLDEMNTSEVRMSMHSVELKNQLREDEPTTCLTQEEALAQTQHKKDGYFKGPKVM